MTVTEFLHHFQIKLGSLFDALGFDQFVFISKIIDAPLQFPDNGFDGFFAGDPGCDIMTRRENGNAFQALEYFASEGVK